MIFQRTACLTLFPEPPEPTPTEELFEPVLTPLEFDPPALPDAKAGVPYEIQIVVTQNVTPVGGFMFDLAMLPPGLELIFEEDGTDTARITGIPEKAGAYTFRVDVWVMGHRSAGKRVRRNIRS